jgi:hypothetical protein
MLIKSADRDFISIGVKKGTSSKIASYTAKLALRVKFIRESNNKTGEDYLIPTTARTPAGEKARRWTLCE